MLKKNLGRILIASGLGLLTLLFAWEAIADEARVIEVRRNIPLSDKDPVYRDFYLNAGLEEGFKANQVVTAVRKINVKDASGTQSFGELMVAVGQLKIIYAGSRIAVAREYKLLSRDNLPMLEQTGVMAGDLIDAKGSFVDNRKTSAKTSSREESAPAEATEASASDKEAAPAVSATEPEVSPKAVMDSMSQALGQVSNAAE